MTSSTPSLHPLPSRASCLPALAQSAERHWHGPSPKPLSVGPSPHQARPSQNFGAGVPGLQQIITAKSGKPMPTLRHRTTAVAPFPLPVLQPAFVRQPSRPQGPGVAELLAGSGAATGLGLQVGIGKGARAGGSKGPPELRTVTPSAPTPHPAGHLGRVRTQKLSLPHNMQSVQPEGGPGRSPGHPLIWTRKCKRRRLMKQRHHHDVCPQ